jgi:hypothetical protein
MKIFGILLAVLLAMGAGCVNVKVEPVEIKPIHITVDVNVRIDKELEEFFSDIDNPKEEAK